MATQKGVVARVRAFLDDGCEASLALLTRLIAEESISGSPTRIERILRTELEDCGMETVLFHADLARLATDSEFSPPPLGGDNPPANIFGRLRGSGGRSLLLFAHIDTEPANGSGWHTAPLQAVTRGKRMYGLGAADDKAGVVSITAAIRALAAAGIQPKGDLMVLLVHGKQGGALGTLPGMTFVGDADAAIYSHPAESGAGLDQIKVASRGDVQFPGRDSGPDTRTNRNSNAG